MSVFPLLVLSFALAAQLAAPELRIEAPPELAGEKARIEAINVERLRDVARLVGLKEPGAPIHITLATGSSDVADSVDPWVAGFAQGERVVIFPSRSPSYPDNTLDDVVRHEVAHVLIRRASSGNPVPRWFNEGLATAAERQGIRDQTQLFLQLAAGTRLTVQDIDRLFDGSQTDQRRAYLLSGALVQFLLHEHGDPLGGRILERVSQGASFEQAFVNAAGLSLADAESQFWNRQRAWILWISILFSQETLWLGIALLALLAIWRHRKRNAEIARRWDEEEQESQDWDGY